MIRSPAHKKGYNVPGELYVIQTRNCVECHKDVFKVGRARCVTRRLSQYPKGSILIFRLPVSRMVDAETMLLNLCRLKFISRTDFGKEYFQGDVLLISRTLLEVADMFRLTSFQVEVNTEDEDEAWSDSDIDLEACERTLDRGTEVDISELLELEIMVEENECDVEACDDLNMVDVLATDPIPRDTDPTILLLKYIHEKESELVGPVDTALLLGKVTYMYREAGCKSNPTLKSLFRDLKHYFKCTEIPLHVFEDGRRGHATLFTVVKQDEEVVGDINAMEQFFAMEDHVRGCSIKYVEGVVTLLSEFKSSFQVERNGVVVKFVYDPILFLAHGFSMKMGTSGKYKVENICRSCKQIATCRHEMCCDEYMQDNRTTSVVIYNMAFNVLEPSIAS